MKIKNGFKHAANSKGKLTFTVVNYETDEKQKEISILLKRKQEILSRKEVNWELLNLFTIKR